MVYDKNGDVLFDGSEDFSKYEAGHFTDVGNIIGDNMGQMSNTLVARNIEKLNNYSFASGLVKSGGKAAIYSTLNHRQTGQFMILSATEKAVRLRITI